MNPLKDRPGPSNSMTTYEQREGYMQRMADGEWVRKEDAMANINATRHYWISLYNDIIIDLRKGSRMVISVLAGLLVISAGLNVGLVVKLLNEGLR